MTDLKGFMHAAKRPLALALVGGALAISLQGCVGVMVGGVAVSYTHLRAHET